MALSFPSAPATGDVSPDGLWIFDAIGAWRRVRASDRVPAPGSYTPTLVNTTNVAASTAHLCYYTQIGDTVTVFGKVDIDPTTASVATELGISLPVPSTFTDNGQLAGVAAAQAVAGYSARLSADTAGNAAQLNFIAGTGVANIAWSFMFSYKVA